METHHSDEVEEEEEYVLLNLDSIFGTFDIPPNTPYVLSALDTLNPILTIGDGLKLIGEYEETIGTCLIFSEEEAEPVMHEESGPSEANLFSGARIVDSNQAPQKQVKTVASLHKILKFKVLLDENVQDAITEAKT